MTFVQLLIGFLPPLFQYLVFLSAFIIGTIIILKIVALILDAIPFL